jgi:hypothetical protein
MEQNVKNYNYWVDYIGSDIPLKENTIQEVMKEVKAKRYYEMEYGCRKIKKIHYYKGG